MAASPIPSPIPPTVRITVLAAAGACLLPLLRQLPDSLQYGFGALAVLVALASWRRPLPGVLRVLIALGIFLGVAAVMPGIGRDTACAVLAGMLALKPAETVTRRDARSLLGFALFAPFATFLLDQGPLTLVLAAIGSVLALFALQRLAADQGQVAQGVRWRDGLPSVLRLTLLGLPLAMAAFWLFPRLPTPLWGVPQKSISRPGLSDEMTPGGFLDLVNDDTPAARVVFDGATPAPSQMYWRGPVLWHFDGRTWTAEPRLRALPPPQVRVGKLQWRYQLELEPTDQHQLVALDVPTQVPAEVRATIDLGLYTRDTLDSVTRWRMQGAPAEAVEPELSPVLRRIALALPRGDNPRTRELALQWRAQAGSDDRAIVLRALRMIQAEFAYTLDVPLDGRNGVDTFLFDRKSGYCEHFSSAFVVLMRNAGIPARVVTGYAGGYRNPIGNYWLIRRSDAHAWAEVWLPQRGWVRIDPTAAVAPERIYDTLADRAPGRFGDFAGMVPAFDAGDWLRRGWNTMVLGFDANRQRRMLQSFGVDDLDPGRLIALLAACTVLALGWMAWWIARGERERDPLLRAWRRLGARYARRGKARAPHEPADAWSARVGTPTPSAGLPLPQLAERFQQARYGTAASVQARRELQRDLNAHRP